MCENILNMGGPGYIIMGEKIKAETTSIYYKIERRAL